MRHVVVDTNVAVVANARSPQASPECIVSCCDRLLAVERGSLRLVLDARGTIFDEYLSQLSLAGQPGAGDLFMRWVHTNRYNPARCELVEVTETAGSGWRVFEEVPDDPDLEGFDSDDQVFVAVSRGCKARPPVLNAVDSDWWDYERVLARNGVTVRFVCEDKVSEWKAARTQKA